MSWECCTLFVFFNWDLFCDCDLFFLIEYNVNFIVTKCKTAWCCPGVESMAVNKPGLWGGKQGSCHISLKTFQSKPSLHAAISELAQIDSQGMQWWRMLRHVSAVRRVHAESNSQVTDLPSGLVISHIDYPLTVDLFDCSGRPQYVTDYSLIHLSTALKTFS